MDYGWACSSKIRTQWCFFVPFDLDEVGIEHANAILAKFSEETQLLVTKDWRAIAGQSNIRSPLKELTYRSRAHSLSDRPVVRPTGRNAAIAVSTVVFFQRPDDYGILIQRRSDTGVAIHGDLWHVAPSFMFQPVVDDVVNEYSVVHNVYREYLEELFHVPEVIRPPAVISHDYFYENLNLAFLRSLLKSGDAMLLFTGVAVNLLNLRPEICTLLYIGSPEWYTRHRAGSGGLSRLELNDEWRPGLSAKPLSWLRMDSPAAPEVVPPGAAALWLALEAAKIMQLPLVIAA